MRVWMTGVLAVAAVFFMVACGGGDDSDHDESEVSTHTPSTDGAIDVHLKNWAVVASVPSVPAGKVTFRAIHDSDHSHDSNEGGKTHDLAVARKQSDGSFDLVGQVKGIPIGASEELSLDLPSGEYELQCNLVEEIGGGKVIAHYVKGMHTPFRVD